MDINSTSALPNATQPIVDPQTLQLRRAISSPQDGFAVYNRLRVDNNARNEKAALIMEKYSDSPPWKQKILDAAKQNWRSNTSTGFMSSMVKRILPAYKQLIDTSRTLTHAHLKNDDPQSQQKSDDFQVEMTKLIRRWIGWEPFCFQLCLEDVLFGYSGAAWTDEVSWQPVFLRQDEALFPDGCPQDSSRVPLWCLRQNFLIHEMVAFLANPEQSELAGWDLDNLVESINQAKPENRRTGTQDAARKYQDIFRETSTATSYMEGVKVIETVHLFAQESWGPVSHYIFDKSSGKQLFVKYDRYENMPQCLRLMSVEVGNGKLHGSKGVGRTLYNTSVAIERSRNLALDTQFLSGLLLLEESDDAKPQTGLAVAHPVAIIGKGFKVAQQKFDLNAKDFEQLDQYLSSIAQQQVGAFMPGQTLEGVSGSDKTASEINYIASIEQQIREGVLARFWAQFLGIITEIQRRIFSEENIEAAYKLYQEQQQFQVIRVMKKMVGFWARLGLNAQLRLGIQVGYKLQIEDPDEPQDECVNLILLLLQKGLGPEEIYELAQCPANQVIDDDDQQNSAAILQLVQLYSGNPNIDQKELRKMAISRIAGYKTYEKLEIGEEDNTVSQEATRMQLLELQALSTGEPVPVSPRDPDSVHMDVIMAKAQGVLQGPIPPQAVPVLTNIFGHFQTHLQSAITKNQGKTDGLEKYAQFADAVEKLMKQGAPPPAPAPAGPPPPPPGSAAPQGPIPHPPDGLPGAPLAGALAPAPNTTGVNMPAGAAASESGKTLPAVPLAPGPDGHIPLPLSGGPIKTL